MIVLLAITGMAYGQSTRIGISIQPELNIVLQSPNSFVVESISPGLGFSTSILMESEMNENWSFRSGLGYNLSSFKTTTPFIFEDDIHPTLGFPLSRDYIFQNAFVPIAFVYHRPESLLGLVVGTDINVHFNRKIERNYSTVSVVEEITKLELNPSINVALQFRFPVGNDANLIIEPFTKVYLRSQEIPNSNMLSTGFRLVYMKAINGD